MRANLFARITDAFPELDDLQGLTVYLSTAEGEPVALAELAQGELRPFRVFNFG
jgi:tRNA pseudouridine55 synthase